MTTGFVSRRAASSFGWIRAISAASAAAAVVARIRIAVFTPSTVARSAWRYHLPMRVRELAEWLCATFEGDGERELIGVAPLETAGESDVAFVGSKKAATQANSTSAGCLLVP